MRDRPIFDFYKESYETELRRKSELLDSIGIALAVLAIIGGFLSFYIGKVNFDSFKILDLLFYVPFAAGLGAALSAGYYLYRAICHSYYYHFIPKPDEIRPKLKEFSEWAKASTEVDENLDEFFERNLETQYCDFASHNWDINKNRFGHTFVALRSAMISMACLVASFPGFYVYQRGLPESTSKVELANPVVVDILNQNEKRKANPMPDKPNNTPQAQPPASPAPQATPPDQAEPQQPAPQKPTWPSGHFLKEADEKNTKIKKG